MWKQSWNDNYFSVVTTIVMKTLVSAKAYVSNISPTDFTVNFTLAGCVQRRRFTVTRVEKICIIRRSMWLSHFPPPVGEIRNEIDNCGRIGYRPVRFHWIQQFAGWILWKLLPTTLHHRTVLSRILFKRIEQMARDNNDFMQRTTFRNGSPSRLSSLDDLIFQVVTAVFVINELGKNNDYHNARCTNCHY